ncbi:MAG: hypothetical protein NT154_23410 [Verrucomicrobia bacterium]|nr:hypothetical protein [Verrucomicrobiota bacterium]
MPTRLTAKDPLPGGSYLHKNGLFVRHIDAIEGDTVHYHDQYGQGFCSKGAFLKVCPSVASPETTAAADQHLTRIEQVTSQDALTLRDEANALTAYAFRNGFLEDLHAGKTSPLLEQPGYSRITDDEMKRLMIEASEKLARMLAFKKQSAAEYDQFIRKYQKIYCRTWKRD